MKTLIFVAVAILLFAFIAVALKGKTAKTSEVKKDLRKKTPLTEREQSMFFRLSSTFPEHVVLSQVAFSALLNTRQRTTRNGFNRKVADFVLCTKAFSVLAIIELDDSSHKNREEADATRDEFLTAAGYRVVRYAQIPDEAKLLSDFLSVLRSPQTKQARSTAGIPDMRAD